MCEYLIVDTNELESGGVLSRLRDLIVEADSQPNAEDLMLFRQTTYPERRYVLFKAVAIATRDRDGNVWRIQEKVA